MIKSLVNFVDQREPDMVGLRRHLHQHPELSGNEFKTTDYLFEQLKKLGVACKYGPDKRGLVVDLGSANPSRRLALRADIDAIPVNDSKSVKYRSSVENVMHACGHDAHSTILYGALGALNQWLNNQSLDIAIRAIFQPEEETAQGAKRMIDWGVLDGVDAIIGAHVDPHRPVGTIGLRSGPVTACCDEVFVKVKGKGGHAARPHQTIDPIAAAVQFISNCYSTMPRIIDSQDPTVLSFGSISGGERSNVIPDEVKISGTLRTLSDNGRARAIEMIRTIADSVSASSGATIEAELGLIVPSVVADPTLTDVVQRTSTELLGAENVAAIPQASMGGEDFAFYCETLPAAFVRLGSASTASTELPLHNSGFDIDEKVLVIGAKVIAHAAVGFLFPENV